MFPCIPQMENRANGNGNCLFATNGKQKRQTNIRLFAENGNGKQRFVFLGGKQ
jgi:hypothetical protein